MPFKSRLTDIANKLRPALDIGLDKTANRVLGERDLLVPIDEGDLLASGKKEQVGPLQYRVSEGEGLPDARAAYTEYGTYKQAAQPHMTPAADVGRKEMPRIVGDEIKRVVS